MKGDAQRVTGLMFAALFTKRTAGSIAAAYEASFWNGETDVPGFGQNTFSSAHAHYAGLNTTTLARAHIEACVEDIAEHGYMDGQFIGLFSQAQISDLSALQDADNKVTTPGRIKAVDQGFLEGGVPIAGVDCFIHPFVPAGYFAVINMSVPPLGRREHMDEGVRGLRMDGEINDPDNPLVGKRFRRRIGFRAAHLGAGVCRQLVASTTYTNPPMRFA